MVVDNYKLRGKRTKTVLFAGKRLEPGKKYNLIFFEKEEKKAHGVNRKMTLVAFYTHHVLFMDARGIRHSYRWWDLEKILKGEQR